MRGQANPSHFGHTDVVHHRYDIKGSWIDRNAKVPSIGDKTACRYCNASYTFGRTKNQECGDGMNFNEPDIVLKDNDLMTKPPRISSMTRFTNSDFLCSQGIMDYILLMGIQSSEYFVDMSQLPIALRDLLFTQPSSVAGPSLYHFGIIDLLQQWYVRRMAVKTLSDKCVVKRIQEFQSLCVSRTPISLSAIGLVEIKEAFKPIVCKKCQEHKFW
ncbi:hypothetical protein PsorP6_013031 [Peronosclerospora sorghi]|uniref:Uncharacterized protein n=1 Tax=Peronosclerospora sorghi TaxID=230839 RepID=A0ACC0WGV0_9STRA|nr:hypothetical protein PsorP6_013031 [Peronosclerospora sorghi]